MVSITLELTVDELNELTAWLLDRKATVQKKRILNKKMGISTTMGKKLGKTSRYHYVSRLADGVTYTGCIWNKGTTINVYRGTSEVMAAKAVDAYLDKIGDTKRPRNKDEFILL